jgi:hypothetical protein
MAVTQIMALRSRPRVPAAYCCPSAVGNMGKSIICWVHLSDRLALDAVSSKQEHAWACHLQVNTTKIFRF